MFQPLNWLFATAPTPVGGVDAAAIPTAVERVIDGVDPRLRAVPHYQRTLRRPVERALHYIAESVQALPSAIPFDRTHSAVDPRLRALFLSPDHLLETLSASPEVRGYVDHAYGLPPTDIFVALRTERTERSILGMSLVDDRLLRDVPQTTVSFHNHRIAFPAETESETRRQVGARAFDYLIEVTRHRLAAIRARRMQLEQQQRLLQGHAKAAVLGRPTWGLWGSAAVAFVPENPGDGQKLLEIEDELGRLRADSATFAEQLDLVAHYLDAPGEHLRFERVSMALDPLNVKVPKRSRRSADLVTFNEMLIGPDRRITIELIRFPSGQLLAPTDPFDSAQGSGFRLG